MAKYSFYIRRNDGQYRGRIMDIESVKIIEKLNDPGNWTIRSRTKDPCPFEPGDGIVIACEGAYFYSGVLSDIKEDFDGYSGLYTWTVQGTSDLEYLKRRVCYPDPSSGSTGSVSYYTDSGTLASVVGKVINKNLGPLALAARQEPLVGAVAVGDEGETVSVSLRFQTLLEGILPLLNAQNFSIRPTWDGSARKIVYQIYESKDLSASMLFSTKLNSIIKLERSIKRPRGNYIISGGTGTKTSRNFAYASNDESTQKWGRIEYFHDMRSTSASELQADANSTLQTYSQENAGYSAEINSDAYRMQYRRDWNLGDYIAVDVNDGIAIQRILQVETFLSYDQETIKPVIGTIQQGQLALIFNEIGALRSDVNQLQWADS